MNLLREVNKNYLVKRCVHTCSSEMQCGYLIPSTNSLNRDIGRVTLESSQLLRRSVLFHLSSDSLASLSSLNNICHGQIRNLHRCRLCSPNGEFQHRFTNMRKTNPLTLDRVRSGTCGPAEGGLKPTCESFASGNLKYP
jgi:hypothetical protein